MRLLQEMAVISKMKNLTLLRNCSTLLVMCRNFGLMEGRWDDNENTASC